MFVSALQRSRAVQGRFIFGVGGPGVHQCIWHANFTGRQKPRPASPASCKAHVSQVVGLALYRRASEDIPQRFTTTAVPADLF